MSSCATCGSLGEHVEADLEAGESLPPAVSQLETIAGGTARRCPTCRALFLYTYDYEYGALGDGWEDATIERVDRDRVVAVLLASPPSSAVHAALVELGVAEGEAAITTKLLADLDDPKASHDAVRKLVEAFVGRSDIPAIERLLRHPHAKVRADTLYQLQTHRGSLIFRALASATDPSPAVREAATTAAFVDPPRDVGLEPAIVACLYDFEDDVRSNAAWTLAVFAEDKRDVSVALPALATRVTGDPSDNVRTTAARALVAAASAGTNCSGIVSIIERLDASDELRTQVLDAIRAEASRTKRVDVWRCPTCGSTDAGPDESRSQYEFTYMQCNGCKRGGLVDSYERDDDWSLTIEVPIHSTELPSHVPPLAPGQGFYELMQAALRKKTPPSIAPAPGPPRALSMGCSRCSVDDAKSSWGALCESSPQTLVTEDRWSLEISTCSCGQSYAVVFTEGVNHRRDNDDLTWLALPITGDERAKLARTSKSQLPGVLVAVGEGRRFLVLHHLGGSRKVWWRPDGFALDPSIMTSADSAPQPASPPSSPPPLPPSPASPSQPLARTIGCSRCFGNDAASAWEKLRTSDQRPLVDEVHWYVDITTCSCGQNFVIEFRERVDYLEGTDDQTWVALPITRDERARLESCDKSLVRSVHAVLDTSRRFLVHNEVGAHRDTWWRDGTLTLEPSIAPTSIEIAFSAEPRDTPTAWLLDAEEVAELWALGVPLDAACVPDEQLRLAITSRRVKQACSDSSMGTAETYWAVAEATDGLVQICRHGVVVPPGETAQETPFEDRADDRDVDGVLWSPFYLEQGAALARSIPQELRHQVVDEYARILADLEERWAKGPKQIERAPFIEWLRIAGPIDTGELERWLTDNTKQSVRHLVQGIRARWLTHDVATAFGAVMTSVERFKADPELQRATRIELLRSAARVVRAR